jgi:hypothetical protein
MDYRSAEASLREGLRYADAIEQSHCRHVMGAAAALVDWAKGRDRAAGGKQEPADRGCAEGTGAEVAPPSPWDAGDDRPGRWGRRWRLASAAGGRPPAGLGASQRPTSRRSTRDGDRPLHRALNCGSGRRTSCSRRSR